MIYASSIGLRARTTLFFLDKEKIILFTFFTKIVTDCCKAYLQPAEQVPHAKSFPWLNDRNVFFCLLNKSLLLLMMMYKYILTLAENVVFHQNDIFQYNLLQAHDRLFNPLTTKDFRFLSIFFSKNSVLRI